jgi:transcriptional regulator with XRE-family HTH domain
MRQPKGFPERLKEARQKRGLNHSELSRLIGKARSTVTNYERGVGRPTLSTLVLIADTLHTSVDTLLGYKPKHE